MPSLEDRFSLLSEELLIAVFLLAEDPHTFSCINKRCHLLTKDLHNRYLWLRSTYGPVMPKVIYQLSLRSRLCTAEQYQHFVHLKHPAPNFLLALIAGEALGGALQGAMRNRLVQGLKPTYKNEALVPSSARLRMGLGGPFVMVEHVSTPFVARPGQTDEETDAARLAHLSRIYLQLAENGQIYIDVSRLNTFLVSDGLSIAHEPMLPIPLVEEVYYSLAALASNFGLHRLPQTSKEENYQAMDDFLNLSGYVPIKEGPRSLWYTLPVLALRDKRLWDALLRNGFVMTEAYSTGFFQEIMRYGSIGRLEPAALVDNVVPYLRLDIGLTLTDEVIFDLFNKVLDAERMIHSVQTLLGLCDQGFWQDRPWMTLACWIEKLSPADALMRGPHLVEAMNILPNLSQQRPTALLALLFLIHSGDASPLWLTKQKQIAMQHRTNSHPSQLLSWIEKNRVEKHKRPKMVSASLKSHNIDSINHEAVVSLLCNPFAWMWDLDLVFLTFGMHAAGVDMNLAVEEAAKKLCGVPSSGAVLIYLCTKFPHLKHLLDDFVMAFEISIEALWDLHHINFRTALGSDWEELVSDKNVASSPSEMIEFAPPRIFARPGPEEDDGCKDDDYRLFPTCLRKRPQAFERKDLLSWYPSQCIPTCIALLDLLPPRSEALQTAFMHVLLSRNPRAIELFLIRKKIPFNVDHLRGLAQLQYKIPKILASRIACGARFYKNAKDVASNEELPRGDASDAAELEKWNETLTELINEERLKLSAIRNKIVNVKLRNFVQKTKFHRTAVGCKDSVSRALAAVKKRLEMPLQPVEANRPLSSDLSVSDVKKKRRRL